MAGLYASRADRELPGFYPRLVGRPSGAPTQPQHTSDAAMFGPFFRVGYCWYPGVQSAEQNGVGRTVQSETSLSGGMLRMTPPTIPYRGATIKGIRNGVNLAQVMAYGSWMIPSDAAD
jgi:hypothetical protein